MARPVTCWTSGRAGTISALASVSLQRQRQRQRWLSISVWAEQSHPWPNGKAELLDPGSPAARRLAPELSCGRRAILTGLVAAWYAVAGGPAEDGRARRAGHGRRSSPQRPVAHPHVGR